MLIYKAFMFAQTSLWTALSLHQQHNWLQFSEFICTNTSAIRRLKSLVKWG